MVTSRQQVLFLYKDHVVAFLAMLSTPELVSRIREHTGDTQERLARRLGVSFPTINAWERGRSTPRRTHRRELEQLAEELGITHEFTVLVIDDDPVTAELVAVTAGELDGSISVDSALNGWEGLVKCGSRHPDLVVLDIMMPGIDGLEVARRLPSIEGLEGVKVVFVTASRSDDVLERAHRFGHAVLPKPLDLDELEKMITSALDSAGPVVAQP